MNIAVLDNDSDGGNPPLTIVSVTNPAHGLAAIQGNQIRYTPNNGYTGNDSFSYSVENACGNTASANVSGTVVNTPPVISGLTAVPNPCTAGIDNPVISFTLGDIDSGHSISWTATLTNGGGGSLSATFGGPVANGTPVSIAFTTVNPTGATITVNATDSLGAPATPKSIIVQVQ